MKNVSTTKNFFARKHTPQRTQNPVTANTATKVRLTSHSTHIYIYAYIFKYIYTCVYAYIHVHKHKHVTWTFLPLALSTNHTNLLNRTISYAFSSNSSKTWPQTRTNILSFPRLPVAFSLRVKRPGREAHLYLVSRIRFSQATEVCMTCAGKKSLLHHHMDPRRYK